MRKLVKWVARLAFSVFVVLGFSGYYVARNFDLNKYKNYASELVEDYLGRKFAVNGEASIGISLVPTLVLEDVELGNAEWSDNPIMLKVQKLELKFALIPLLKKQIVVDKAILNQPELYLEISAEGKNNWNFANLQKPKVQYANSGWLIKSAYAQMPEKDNDKVKKLVNFAAKQVLIENGLINIVNRQKDKQDNITIKQVAMSVPNADAEITTSFEVTCNQNIIEGEAVLGSLNELIEDAKPYPVYVKAKAYGVDWQVNGYVSDWQNNLSYDLASDIYNPAGNFDIPEIELQAVMQGDLKKLTMDINKLSVAKDVITGKIKADISRKLPEVAADLQSNKLDIRNWQSSKHARLPLNLNLIKTAYAADYITNEPFPYELLQKFNAKTILKIKKLIVTEGMQASNVYLKGQLRNKVLQIRPLRLDFGGGEIDVNTTIDAQQQKLNITAVSKDVLLQNLHKEFAIEGKGDFGVVDGGNTDVNLNLNSKGKTYRELVQNMQGQAIVIINKSLIQTGKLKLMTGNFITEILHALNFSDKKVANLDLRCAVLRTDIANGKAVFPKGIAVNAKQFSLVSDGKINLINDKVNFTLQPFSGKLVDTNVAQAVSSFLKIKGTVQKPVIAIDNKEAIRAMVGFATTGGTAYLGSKLLLDPDGNPCYTALEGTPYENRFPKPKGVYATTKGVYKSTTDSIASDVKALKNSAKEFLNIFKRK